MRYTDRVHPADLFKPTVLLLIVSTRQMRALNSLQIYKFYLYLTTF